MMLYIDTVRFAGGLGQALVRRVEAYWHHETLARSSTRKFGDAGFRDRATGLALLVA